MVREAWPNSTLLLNNVHLTLILMFNKGHEYRQWGHLIILANGLISGQVPSRALIMLIRGVCFLLKGLLS